MSEASHHDSPDVVHYNLPDDRTKSHGASFALTVLCVVLAVGAGALTLKYRQQVDATNDLRTQLDRANSEMASAKTDLTKAGASLTDLHAQLNKAGSQQAELQAQIKKFEQSSADLQGQVDKAAADLKSAQEKAQSEATDLQAQLAQAKDSSTGLQSELAKSKGQVDDLKAQLEKAKTDVAPPQPEAAKARELPLTSKLNKSFWGGFTLELKNSGPDPLKLDIQITGSPKTPSKTATIEGGGTMELSGLAEGATIAIASDGFNPISLTAK